MKKWEDKAKELLKNTLSPLPHEMNEIDWKVDISENGEKVARHLSAFSNYSGGGFLVFGISNNGEIVGLGKNECDEIVKKLGNIARDGVETAINIDHAVYDLEGKGVLFVFIGEAQAKPIHTRRGTIFDAYTRSAGQTRKMTRQEVSLAISSSQNLTFETKLASETMSPIDILSRLDFTAYFDLVQKSLPSSPESILDALASERMVKRVEGGYCITNLGALLFAKNLEEFKELTRHSPRIVVYDGKSRIKRLKEINGNKGYASGFVNLIESINNLLPANEIIGEALREDVRVYPEIAIRELVANALIHQDFDVIGSGPTIEVFEDRIEIRNPGKPLIQTERFVDYPPRSRNEGIASLMRRLRICEELGTGIDKVVFQCEVFQLPAPSFVVKDDHLIATLYTPRPLTKMAKEDRVRACYLHACLRCASSGESTTNESVRRRFGITDRNYPIASKIINETLQAGLIIPKDPKNKSRKHAKYLPYWGQ